MMPVRRCLMSARLRTGPSRELWRTRTCWAVGLGIFLTVFTLVPPDAAYGRLSLPCLTHITSQDALLLAGPDGKILCGKNEKRPCIPASSLKVLTALAFLDRMGPSYRFRTEFYMDATQNLKVKGYGDPLLISEALQEIAVRLKMEIQTFQSLLLDVCYFSPEIVIPGCGGSTNPYDAPVGALCANFNTVAFKRDKKGRILSAERQTPLIPYARDRIRSLGLKRGRYTFIHDSQRAARYAGELLLYFLRKEGVACDGTIRLGEVVPTDRLIHRYASVFSLEEVVQKMMESSSNFMANQLLLVLGAETFGPPATLDKGVRAVMDFAKKSVNLNHFKMVEGSGLSRQNRISASDMLDVLKRFKAYRYLLKNDENVFYKTGSLKGIRTRVGYVENGGGDLYYFVIFFNQPRHKMNATLNCVKRAVARRP